MKILSLSKLIISVLLIIGILAGPVSADFQQFLDNTVIQFDSPAHYSAGGEHFVFGGGIHIRTPSMTFQPFSITPPSFRGGCSGLDMTFGAFRYLDVDKFVQFVKNIMSNAPGFAFQLGMDVLCPKCQDLMNKLSALANQINSLQFDSCRMLQAGKKTLASLMKRDIEEQGNNKSWMDQVSETLGKATVQVNKLVDYLNNFGQGSGEHWVVNTQKTVLQEALTQMGLENDRQLRAALTAIFGDMGIIRRAEDNGGDPVYDAELAIPILDQDFTETFFFGCLKDGSDNVSLSGRNIKILEPNGTCTKHKCEWVLDDAAGVVPRLCSAVRTQVELLFHAYSTRIPLEHDAISLIYALPMPTIKFLNTASAYPELIENAAFKDAISNYITARLALSIMGAIRTAIFTKLSFNIDEDNKNLFGKIESKKREWLEAMRLVSMDFVRDIARRASAQLESFVNNIITMIDVENKLAAQLQQKGIWQSYMLSRSLVTGR